MNGLIFKIDKEIDFRNHLIRVRSYDKNRLVFKDDDKKYFESIKNSKDMSGQWDKFEKYSADFYSEENKENVESIIKRLQKLWDEVGDKYVKKMEEVHGEKFPHETIYAVLSTTPKGWGFNFYEDKPWLTCLNRVSQKNIDIAMHEIMHAFFIKYFKEEYKKKFKLSENQVWIVRESLTVILNLEVRDLMSEEDKGYSEHKELREKIKKSWNKHRKIKKVLTEVCQIVKEEYK